MSVTLLERFRTHLDAGNLLDGYQVKFYRWSDQDLNGSGQRIIRYESGERHGGGSSRPVV